MSTTQLSVSEFKAHCTAILRELEAHPRCIEVTNRGRVIAVVAPPNLTSAVDPAAWLGSLRGSVVRYEEPFAPATESSAWDVLRP